MRVDVIDVSRAEIVFFGRSAGLRTPDSRSAPRSDLSEPEFDLNDMISGERHHAQAVPSGSGPARPADLAIYGIAWVEPIVPALKKGHDMLKFLGGTIGVIFLIGLVVVIGILALIF